MTDLDLMTPATMWILGSAGTLAWGYLFATMALRSRARARRRATYRHPAGRALSVDILRGSERRN